MNENVERRMKDCEHHIEQYAKRIDVLRNHEHLIDSIMSSVLGSELSWMSLYKSAGNGEWYCDIEFLVLEPDEERIDAAIFFLYDLGYAPISSMYGGYSYGYQVQTYNELQLYPGIWLKLTFKFSKHQEPEYVLEKKSRALLEENYEVSCKERR